MSTVKEAWSNRCQNSGRIKWLSILTEFGWRNIRSITELESLELSV